jgi:hypothetical protein
MKKIFFILSIAISTSVVAQEKTKFKPHFVNMTEFGGLFGRTVYNVNNWNGSFGEEVANRLSFTLQTFNGVQLKPRLAVGATVGIDWYKAALIMPIAAGVRYDLVKNSSQKSSLYASLDAGYGFNWLNVNASNYTTSGGLMLNPGIGLRVGLKSQSALLISLTYKRQDVQVTQPLYWSEIDKYENRTYNRMAFRIGVSF